MSALTKTAGFGLVAALGFAAYNFGDDIADAIRSSGSSNQNQPTATITVPSVPLTINSNTAITLKELTVNDPSTGTNEKTQVLTAPLASLKHRHDSAMGNLFGRARDAAHIGSTETTIQIDEAWGAAERRDGFAGKKLVVYDAANDAFQSPDSIGCVVDAARVAEQDASEFSQSIAYRFLLNESKTDLGKEWTMMVRDIGEDNGFATIDPSATPSGPDMEVIYECSFDGPTQP